MNKTINIIYILAVFLIMWVLCLGVTSIDTAYAKGYTATAKTLKRWYDPVELRGELLANLVGKPIANLRVYSLQQDRFWPIPFQIDERTPSLKFVLPEGYHPNPNDSNGIFDKEDLLLVMARNSGDRLQPGIKFPQIDDYTEIELIDPLTQGRGWVYISFFNDNPPENISPPRMYFKYVDKALLTGSDFYNVQGFVNRYLGEDYSTVMPERLVIPKTGGGAGVNILDRVKFRAEARTLFGAINMKANETDFIGRVDSWKVGPLRIFGRNWAAAKLPLGIRSPKLWADVYCYESYIIIPIVVKVPFNPNIILTDTRARVGFDLNKAAIGMKYYNSNNLKGFKIDGKMDDDEKAMNQDADEWRCVTGPQGTIITRTVWDERSMGQTQKASRYIDDLEVKIPPENIPGQIGYHYMEDTITNVTSGNMDVTYIFYFPPFFYQPNQFNLQAIQQLLNIRDKPLQVKVQDTIEPNTAGLPFPLSPYE